MDMLKFYVIKYIIDLYLIFFPTKIFTKTYNYTLIISFCLKYEKKISVYSII